MDENKKSLAIARIDRAKELYKTAVYNLNIADYKTVNNRTYYSLEKAITSLLVLEGSSPKTHKGIISEFNRLYINDENSTFTREDLNVISEAERIRTASDYDDFYIASKSKTQSLLDNGYMLINKIISYLKTIDVLAPDYELL
ncbi:MAG: HEPN domain-containing protein [Lachnospiraceae bacterium]|nr:HEPN domain-containing protein [Lachnospiraceae bacterium]